MAAGTQNLSSVNAYTFASIAKRQMRDERLPDDHLRGSFSFTTGARTVAATNTETEADELFVLTFPEKCYLEHLLVTITDVDTNATPTLVFDVIVENSAGTEVVLINDATIGQAGGTDELDANLFLTDVSEKKLGIKVVTGSATAAAGTITFKGRVWLGNLPTIA